MTKYLTTLAPLPIPSELPNIGTVVSAVRLPDQECYSPGYLVICQRPVDDGNDFTTNIAYSDNGGVTWSATEGNYDMTFEEAREDLTERVARGI